MSLNSFKKIALISLALLTCGPSLHAATPAPSAPTVVLVHGAFGTAESWDKVIPILARAHVPVVSVSLPLTSLADDAAATRRIIDRVKGPVVLVGHSWGGTVITQVGDAPNVQGLVYVAGFANHGGQSVGELLAPYPPAQGLAKLDVAADGYARMSDAGFADDFAPQSTPAERALMAATQTPINTHAFGEPVSHAAWESKPSWFVLTTQDHMIQPALQEAMAADAHAHLTRVASDHAVMASHPQAVADVVLAAVKAAR